MLLDPQVGVVTEEAVQHVERIAHSGVDHLRVEWAVLIRYSRRNLVNLLSIGRLDTPVRDFARRID